MSAESPISVAQYIRGSTDQQKYSTTNQSATNHAYAAMRGMEIVRTFADEGRSGLSLKRREGLQQLIQIVQNGKADFKAILVYDVSRWGRFQDADESAHLEYICKRAGISVYYCAEQFENDGSPFAAIVKAIKRAMAGEYSRELSGKVFAGQSRLVSMGYRLGGSAGYGLRRMLIDQTGKPKGILLRGQRKSISTDRIILVPGPKREIELVRWIFKASGQEKKGPREIAKILNERGIKSVRGGPWRSDHVRHILRNENYIGNSVWNRQSFKLGVKLVNNKPEEWVRFDGAFEAIVAPSLFDAAHAIIRKRREGLSQEEKLRPLRRLFRKHGTLSAKIIDRSRGVPSSLSYTRWFGSLLAAYELVGFHDRAHCRDGRPRHSFVATTRRLSNDQMLEMLRVLRQTHGYLNKRMIDQAEGIPSAGTFRHRFGSLKNAYALIGFYSRKEPK